MSLNDAKLFSKTCDTGMGKVIGEMVEEAKQTLV